MIGTIQTIEEIRDLPEPPSVYVVCTGAGAGLQKLLWDVPGCSRFLVGAAFPYAEHDTADFLGFGTEQACSQKAALQLAMRAYEKAWTPGCQRAVGLGLTAVVATNRQHKGSHRVYIATVTESGCRLHSAYFEKGRLSREEEGRLCDLLALHALRCALGLKGTLTELIELEGCEEYELLDADAEARNVFFERPFFAADGTRSKGQLPHGALLFPGCFNPPHAGHYGMASAASIHGRVVFNITVDPPHKAALTIAEMLQRARMLEGRDLLFTRGDALYIEKARRNPGIGIVIGADALERMMDPKWGAEVEPMLDEFQKLGTRFYAAVRNGIWPASLVPPRFCPNLVLLEGEWNISSTELRTAC